MKNILMNIANINGGALHSCTVIHKYILESGVDKDMKRKLNTLKTVLYVNIVLEDLDSLISQICCFLKTSFNIPIVYNPYPQKFVKKTSR